MNKNKESIHPLQAYLDEQKSVTPLERMRNHFYANSPFDLASKNDDKYRDAIDETLDELYTPAEVKEHNPDLPKVSQNELIDAVYLAQRELREFYLPSQSEAMRVMNDLIKRLEAIKRGRI
jgi:hypothetical protein